MLIANIDGFWDPLLALLEHMTSLEFISSGLSINLLVVDRVESILPKLKHAAIAVSDAEAAMARAAADRM